MTLSLPPGIEFSGVVQCVLRVYVVRAHNLRTKRNTATCDPYIAITSGKRKKIRARKNYVPDTLDPIFGQYFELEINLPQDHHLVVTVMDNRRLLPGILLV